MPFADLSTGARLFYEEAGEGEPLLVVHGLLGTARLHFPRVIDWLSPEYRVIGPTLRGYGESTPKPRDFPLRFYHRDADDVLAFMDALGIQQTHILGYSDGGEAALVAAGQQPERFKSVAVIGAVGTFDPAIRPRIQTMYPGDWITAEERQMHGIPNVDAFVLQWINAMKHYIDAGGDISLGNAHKIACPLLIMLGEKDTLNPATYAQKFLAETANGQLATFACGHPVHDEQWDEFKRIYGDFLKAAN